MMRYYDRKNRRLVYIDQSATPDFWDRQWESETLQREILAGAKERFVFPLTRKYLKIGSKILEGGCGKGQFVYSLHAREYDAYGVDFAENIVLKTVQLFPELKIRLGDVRRLDFPDEFFDGYWSLGVIEHFFEGYETIAREMFRILKPKGYLFLTFPAMSPLRKLKVFFGAFPSFNRNTFDASKFYQFALSIEPVIQTFEAIGFKLVEKKPYEGFKGFKDESGPLKPLLQKIYNAKGIAAQLTCYALSKLLAPLTNHTVLLVLRKK